MPRQRTGKANTDVAEVQRVVELLRTVIRLFGTNREVERKLGMRTGYLSRIFGGAVELRVEHVIAVCRALEMLPGEFYFIAFGVGTEPVTEAGRKAYAALRPQGAASVPARKAGQAMAAKPPGAPATLEDVDARIRTQLADFLVVIGKLFGASGG